jgi:uncharacterized membrane protein
VGVIRAQIDIQAPVERIWAAVHQDIDNVPVWSESLLDAEVVGGGPLRVGSELVYVVKLPAGRTQDLELVVTECDEYRRCAGTVRGGPMRGTWKWTYKVRKTTTRVIYVTTVKLGGPLRLVRAFVEEQAASDVRRNLEGLKRYVESGEGRSGA